MTLSYKKLGFHGSNNNNNKCFENYNTADQKEMENRSLCYLVLFLALSATTANAYVRKCVYTFFIKTGEILNAGTDSNIGLTLSDAGGRSVEIPNLKNWGLMEARRDYFERGHRDIFSGRETCLEPPICHLKLVSDHSGSHRGWFVEYVDVAISRPDGQCAQLSFPINNWLGAWGHPFELHAHLPGCPVLANAKKSATKVLDH